MRKIVVSMHITLDGFVSGPNGEMDWITLDDEMFDFVGTFTQNADTALYGRITYQMMENYWPTAGSKKDASKHDIEHSEWYNRVGKIVFSKTLKNSLNPKTIFLSKNISQEIQTLKNKKGKNILIFGSPTAVQSLIQYNLIDEYWLFVNPIILGKGKPLFPKRKNSIPLILQKTKKFPCGVIGLHYKTKNTI